MILPLTQSDSTRPVYDAAGKVVSFTQHSEMIVKALNLVHYLSRRADLHTPVDRMDSAESVLLDKISERAQEIVGMK